jgi:hypothetical protein
MNETKDKPGSGKPDRAERLAEALRENLRNAREPAQTQGSGPRAP